MPIDLKIGIIGIDHDHIFGMLDGMLAAGATLQGWTTGDETPEAVCDAFRKTYPDAAESTAEALLNDENISLILSSTINSSRADIAIRAMRYGKDVMVDKPGCTTLQQLAEIRETVAQTGRIWSVCFSERFRVESCTLADRLISEGRIGKVVQTVGLGPHLHKPWARPSWFWERDKTGGILTDICAHQFDQFLHFTGSTDAKVAAAHIGNVANADRPDFQDFGEALIEGNGGRGYARVDWLTPDGLGVWGDGRVTILGTQGYIELRKYVDIAGKAGDGHVFLVNNEGVERFSAKGSGLPYFARLAHDIETRSETAMPQAHAFLATELALTAQQMAENGASS